MTIDEYVAIAVSKIDPQDSVANWKKELEDIYEELENIGYSNGEVFALINKAITAKLRSLNEQLNNLTGEQNG